MRVTVEQLVEWRLAGETEVLGENLIQRHFVHHKIPHDRPGLELPICNFIYLNLLGYISLKIA
jgi:hypothetical protein